jgi:preprotein translocase subunit Sss1
MTTVKPAGERFAMVFVIAGVTIVWVGVAWFAITSILHGWA